MRHEGIVLLVLFLGCIQSEQAAQELNQTYVTGVTESSLPEASPENAVTEPARPEPSPIYAPTAATCEPEWQCATTNCAGGKQTRTCMDANMCAPDTSEEMACRSLDHVIFSEIMYDPPGKESAGEWVKLYNPMDSTINALNWSISDNSGEWNFSAAVKSMSHLIIARNAEGFTNLTGCAAGVAGLNRGLNNDGDFLVLRDSGRREIDFVAWAGGHNNSHPSWSVSAKEGKSLLRTSLDNDANSVSDWTSGDPMPCA